MKLHVQQSWTHSVMAFEGLYLRITFWRVCVFVCVCVVAGTSSSKVGQQQNKERTKTQSKLKKNCIMGCLQATQEKESVTLTCFGAVFDYGFLIIYIKSHQWWTDDTHAVFGSLNKAQLLICRPELLHQTNTKGKLQLPTEVCNQIFRCACAVKGRGVVQKSGACTLVIEGTSSPTVVQQQTGDQREKTEKPSGDTENNQDQTEQEVETCTKDQESSRDKKLAENKQLEQQNNR